MRDHGWALTWPTGRRLRGLAGTIAGTGIRLTRRVFQESRQDRIPGLAAEVSFWTMLSLPSLLLGLLGLVGYAGHAFGSDISARVAEAILDQAGQIFTTTTIDDVIRPLVREIVNRGNADLLSVGMVLALWSGSTAMTRYVSAITTAYDMPEVRSWWRTRALGLALYLGALLASVVVLPPVVLGPQLVGKILADLPGPDLRGLIPAGYWLVVSVLSVAVLTTLYHVAVPARTAWSRDLPGALLALLTWIAGSALLRTYLGSSLRDGSAGAASVAAPIAILVFFYVTALSVLVGAELNAAVNQARSPSAPTASDPGRR